MIGDNTLTNSRLVLRRNLYRQAFEFARSQAPEYNLLVRSDAATDPMNMETKVPDGELAMPDTQLCDPPRERWNGLHAFFSASFCDSLELGPPTAIVMAALQHSLLSVGLCMSSIVFILGLCLPVMIMEHSLGQIFQGSFTKVYACLHRRTRLFGFTVFILSILQSPLVSLRMAENMLYFAYSFSRKLPWELTLVEYQNCTSQRTEANCTSTKFCQWKTSSLLNTDGKMQNVSLSPADSDWHFRLKESANLPCCPSINMKAFAFYEKTIADHHRYDDSVDHDVDYSDKVTSFNYKRLVGLAISLCLTTVLAFFGLSLMGRLATFTAIACIIYYFLLVILTFGLEHDTFFFSFDSDKPLKDVWESSVAIFGVAGRYILFSWGTIFGNQCTLASYNSVHCSSLKVAPLVTLVRLTAILLIGTATTSLRAHAFWLAKRRCIVVESQSAQSASHLPMFFNDWKILFFEFPMFLSFLPATPIHSIVFYFINWMFGTLTLAFCCLTFRNTIKGIGCLPVLSNAAYTTIFMTLNFVISIPFLFDYNSISLIHIQFLIKEQIIGCGISVTGIFVIFGTIWAAGLKTTIEKIKYWRLAVYNIATIIGLLLGVFVGGFAFHLRTAKYFFLLSYFLGVLLIIPLSLFCRPKKMSFMKSFYLLLIGDAEVFSHKVNHIINGQNKIWRLRMIYSILLRIFAPFLLLTVVQWTIISMKDEPHLRHLVTLRIVIFFTALAFISTLLLISIVFPKITACIIPSKENRVVLSDVPCQDLGPKYAIRRLRFWPWEEFRPVTKLWQDSFELEFRKLR